MRAICMAVVLAAGLGIFGARARRPRLPMAQLSRRRMPTTARSSRSWAVAAAAGTVGRAEDAAATDRKLSKRFGP
jgi:hypothetical protein